MNLLTFIILWTIGCIAIGCIALVVLNAKFWRLFPDKEQEQYNQDKAQNSPSTDPTIKDTLHGVRLFLLGVVVIVCIVYFLKSIL